MDSAAGAAATATAGSQVEVSGTQPMQVEVELIFPVPLLLFWSGLCCSPACVVVGVWGIDEVVAAE
jgi:hypothetical protein